MTMKASTETCSWPFCLRGKALLMLLLIVQLVFGLSYYLNGQMISIETLRTADLSLGESGLCSSLKDVFMAYCPADGGRRLTATQWGIVHSGQKLMGRNHAFAAGLGNRLFAVMSTIGIAKKLNRQAIFVARQEPGQENLLSSLVEISAMFPGLIPEEVIDITDERVNGVNEELVINECCLYVDPQTRLNQQQQQQPLIGLIGAWLQSFKYFYAYRDQYEPILKRGLRVFEKISATMVPNEVLDPQKQRICLHTRRGGFTGEFHQASTQTFLRHTIQHFTSETTDQEKDSVEFLIFGDDFEWMNSTVPLLKNMSANVHVVHKAGLTPPVTWHFFARYCDKVVITASSSTFGWWGAYFAQMHRPGVEVYFNKKVAKSKDYLNDHRNEDFFLPNWKALDFENGDD